MNDLEILKQQVRELMDWKEARTRQQISFPLDSESILILGKYFLRIISTFIQVGGVASRAFNYFFVKQDNMTGSIPEDLSEVFIVNTTTDYLTVTVHPFANDDRVYVFTSDTLPTPLSSLTTYYVINVSGFTFQISTSLSGAAVNITDVGVGTHYINYL